MNYAALARVCIGADDGYTFLPDDEGVMWDPSVVTRALDATPKKTYAAIVNLALIAARVAQRAASLTASGGPKRAVVALTECVKQAGTHSGGELASTGDWNNFRTQFLQAFWEYNGATAEAKYRSERISFWKEIKSSWEEVKNKLAEAALDVAAGAGKAVKSLIPPWGWALLIIAGVIALGAVAAPIVVPLLSARLGQTRRIIHQGGR